MALAGALQNDVIPLLLVLFRGRNSIVFVYTKGEKLAKAIKTLSLRLFGK